PQQLYVYMDGASNKVYFTAQGRACNSIEITSDKVTSIDGIIAALQLCQQVLPAVEYKQLADYLLTEGYIVSEYSGGGGDIVGDGDSIDREDLLHRNHSFIHLCFQ